MRVLYVTRDYPPAVGGMERNAAEMTAALARLGHAVRVLAPHGSAPMPGAELHAYRLLGNWHVAGAWLRWLVLGHALAFRPDVIIANTWSPCGWAARLAARLANVPLFIVAHGLDVREPLARPATRRLELATLRACTTVLAVSHYTKAVLVYAGLPPDRVRIVANGVDCARFSPKLSGSKTWRTRLNLPCRQLIITVARLMPHKGHATVLEALALLVARGYDPGYLIVGDGPERAALEQLAAARDLQGRVRFLAAVTENELPLAYAAADVLAMPSVPAPDGSVEGFGIAYLEGSAAGLPVIGCSGSGAEDAIVDGGTGWLIPPGDSTALAEKLALLADRPLENQLLGAAGRVRAANEFSWDSLARKLTGILEQRS